MKARCFECRKKPAKTLPNPYGEQTPVFCSIRCAAHHALGTWWQDTEADQETIPQWDETTNDWEWRPADEDAETADEEQGS